MKQMMVRCDWCGVRFEKLTCELYSHNFCSREHFYLWNGQRMRKYNQCVNAIDAFQTDPAVRVFVGQIATAGLGITLTAASTMIFYSLDYSMSNYEQTRARIHRVGQKQPCTYIHLVARGTIDEKVLKALRDKANLAKALVDDYRAGRNPFTP